MTYCKHGFEDCGRCPEPALHEPSCERALMDLQSIERLRGHTDKPFLIEMLETYKRRSERLKRPKHAEYISDLIALLEPDHA